MMDIKLQDWLLVSFFLHAISKYKKITKTMQPAFPLLRKFKRTQCSIDVRITLNFSVCDRVLFLVGVWACICVITVFYT